MYKKGIKEWSGELRYFLMLELISCHFVYSMNAGCKSTVHHLASPSVLTTLRYDTKSAFSK